MLGRTWAAVFNSNRVWNSCHWRRESIIRLTQVLSIPLPSRPTPADPVGWSVTIVKFFGQKALPLLPARAALKGFQCHTAAVRLLLDARTIKLTHGHRAPSLPRRPQKRRKWKFMKVYHSSQNHLAALQWILSSGSQDPGSTIQNPGYSCRRSHGLHFCGQLTALGQPRVCFCVMNLNDPLRRLIIKGCKVFSKRTSQDSLPLDCNYGPAASRAALTP